MPEMALNYLHQGGVDGQGWGGGGGEEEGAGGGGGGRGSRCRYWVNTFFFNFCMNKTLTVYFIVLNLNSLTYHSAVCQKYTNGIANSVYWIQWLLFEQFYMGLQVLL